MPKTASVNQKKAEVVNISKTLELLESSHQSEAAWPEYSAPGVVEGLQESPDHFIHRDGLCFAGTHLIIDLWDAKNLDNLSLMEETMRKAVEVSGATLLHIHLHHFTPNGGISGVAVLAESHISVHTWPERNYAAFDVFMCGDAQPENSIDVFKKAFAAKRVNVLTELRGLTQGAITSSNDETR